MPSYCSLRKWKAFSLYGVGFAIMIGLYQQSFRWMQGTQYSFYGLTVMLYFLIQLFASYLNRRRYESIAKHVEDTTITNDGVRLVLMVVGHRENPVYWEQCLQSITNLHPATPLVAVYVIIDGQDDEEDYAMYDQATDFFATHSFRGREGDAIEGAQECQVYISIISKRGKRGVMKYGFEKIRLDTSSSDLLRTDVVVTDSDTVLDSQSLLRLYECLHSDDRNGCATGTLSIFNLNHYLPHLIDTRYAYAFNIERACASYFGCMTCCSGPLSIYRLSIVSESLLQRFVSQRLCGVVCEPGDDRHLTNLIMMEGYRSRQTHLAQASTEAPERLFRYMLQQLRWNRSFYRELAWQIQCIPTQSWMLHFISLYELLFPFFVTTWLVMVFGWYQSLDALLRGFVITVIILIVRSILLAFRMSRIRVLIDLPVYFLLYFVMLLPLKLYATVTVLNNSWVTPSRNHLFLWYRNCSWDVIVCILWIALWNLGLSCGIVWLVINDPFSYSSLNPFHREGVNC